MAGYVMKMNILVPNINHRGQKDLSSEVRHKAYARPLCLILENRPHKQNRNLKLNKIWQDVQHQ